MSVTVASFDGPSNVHVVPTSSAKKAEVVDVRRRAA